MKRLKELLHEFKYAGLTEKELEMCIPDVRNRNVNAIGQMLIIMMIVLSGLYILSLIPGSGETTNNTLYFIFELIMVIEAIIYLVYFKRHPEQILFMDYLFVLTAYGFGIYEAVFLGTESSITVVCAFLTIVPSLVIDIPLRLALCSIFVEIALLLCNFLVVNETPDRFLVLESICCTSIGISCGFVVQKIKYSDIRNHLIIQMQRDTDIMTGACSRSAYIRDIDLISEKGITGGVIYADVNGLKKANDTFGHEAGDKLIKDAYALMIGYFHGAKERIYRIGGDEFVIISLGEDKDNFEARFNAMMQDDRFGEILCCGFSWQDNVRDMETMIKEAETMMYERKSEFYLRNPDKDRRIM